GRPAGYNRPRTRIGEIDAALRIHEQVVGRKQRHASGPLSHSRDAAVLVALGNALTIPFGKQEFTVSREGETVRPVGVLTNHRNLAADVEIINFAYPDIGEIEATVRGADRALGKYEALLHEVRHGA